MSFTATFNTFANVSNVTPGQRLVLAAISTFTNRQGTCFPSLKVIAQRTSLTVRSVQRHLASLISLGYIERIYRTGTSAITRLNLSRLTPTPDLVGGGDRNDMGGGDKKDIQNLSVEHIKEIAASPTYTANAAIVVFTENEQPTTPKAITKEMPDVLSIDSLVRVSEVAGCHPQAGMPVEAYTAPQEPSQEVLATDPLADVPATPDQAVEADPLAEVPATLLADLGEVRKAKKRTPKPTKTEVQHWYSEALKAGWTMKNLITLMVLRGWSSFGNALWLENIPQHTITSPAPAAPKLWQPTPHTPASPEVVTAAKAKLAALRAQIVADSARRREEQMARPIRR